jgi:hypothetical protein
MRFSPRTRWALSILGLLVSATTGAAEPLHRRIDQIVAAGARGYAKRAAPVAPDAEFLRRVYLDLAGHTPPASETRAFLADTDPGKRTKLIDRLLASPDYARRMASYFDVVLMDRRRDAKVPRAAWEEFLRTAFAENRPYDKLVRELLSADGTDPKTRVAAKFLLDRDFEPTMVTRDISRVFLGKNIQCAQCHDHPLVDDYKQEHFYGIQAFFNRAFLFPNAQDAKAVIAEKADGEVTFTSVFDKSKAQKSTPPRMPGLKPVGDPKAEKGKEYKVAPAKDVRPVPTYSRFSQLAAALTHAENVAFRRTAANRLWAMMIGRGLIHPLDADHSANPASHPELLTLLADEFVAHQFDVKYLLREIALSDTYQRTSEVPAAMTEASPDRLLVATMKPLSPEQLAYSVLEATGAADAERLVLGKNLTDAALHAKLVGTVPPFRSMFGTRPGEPEEGFAATLDQTLFLKHGAVIRNLIGRRNGNLLDRTAKLTDPAAVADELFLSVFTRRPTADEAQDIAEALKTPMDRAQVLAEVIWAMLASAEFRFNH